MKSELQALGIILLLLSGCAKTATPQPPAPLHPVEHPKHWIIFPNGDVLPVVTIDGRSLVLDRPLRSGDPALDLY